MALGVFSRLQHHPPAAIEATVRYHRLLQTLQGTISSLSVKNIDACLLTIFFMGRYEDTIHTPNDQNPDIPFAKKIRSFSHHDGATAILKIWKDRLSHIYPPSAVIKHTRRGLIRSALLRNLALPAWMQDGRSYGEEGLDAEYDSIVVQITGIRQRVTTLIDEDDASQVKSTDFNQAIADLDEESQDIDIALQTWVSHFPSSWTYTSHTISNPEACPRDDFISSKVYSYPDLSSAAMWTHYFATRMLHMRTRLKILSLNPYVTAPGFAYEQHIKCHSSLHALSDDLASSLPYCLRKFSVSDDDPISGSDNERVITLNKSDEGVKPYQANLAVWPLSIVSSLGELDVKQRAWFRTELTRVGKMLGCGVFDCVEKGSWLEL